MNYQDPKYQFGTNDTIHHRAGNYDIPTDEPLVLFRGKDTGTLYAMEKYKEYMEYQAKHADNEDARRIAIEHAITITERIQTITKFQKEHPERIGIGCHTCKPQSITTKQH